MEHENDKTQRKTKLKLEKEQHLCCEKSNLSTSMLPSPSLEADEPRDKAPRISPGRTSSLRCTVNEFLPFLPKPMRRFRPFIWFYDFFLSDLIEYLTNRFFFQFQILMGDFIWWQMNIH